MHQNINCICEQFIPTLILLGFCFLELSGFIQLTCLWLLLVIKYGNSGSTPLEKTYVAGKVWEFREPSVCCLNRIAGFI